MRARARPRPRTPGVWDPPPPPQKFCGGGGRFSAHPDILAKLLWTIPTFPPPRTAGRNTSRLPPGSHGASSGLGQDPRMACGCRECGVDVSSDSSEPPSGTPHRLQGEPRPRTAHLAPEAGSGYGRGARAPRTAGKPSSGGGQGSAPRDRGRQRAGIGRRQICTVPGASTRIARRRRSARRAARPSHGQSEWSASAVICGDHERPE